MKNKKTALILLLYSIALSSASANPSTEEKPLIMSDDCIGNICINDERQKVIANLKDRKLSFSEIDLQLEGMYSPATRVIYGSGHFDIEFHEDEVWRITNHSQEIKDANGIGPGTSIKELFTIYTFKEIIIGEGLYGLIVHEVDYTFIIEWGDVGDIETLENPRWRSHSPVPIRSNVICCSVRNDDE